MFLSRSSSWGYEMSSPESASRPASDARRARIDHSAGRRWIDDGITTEDYFDSARREAAEEATAEIDSRLRHTSQVLVGNPA